MVLNRTSSSVPFRLNTYLWRISASIWYEMEQWFLVLVSSVNDMDDGRPSGICTENGILYEPGWMHPSSFCTKRKSSPLLFSPKGMKTWMIDWLLWYSLVTSLVPFIVERLALPSRRVSVVTVCVFSTVVDSFPTNRVTRDWTPVIVWWHVKDTHPSTTEPARTLCVP